MLRRLITCFSLPCRNIRQKDITSTCIAIPTEHRVDGVREFGLVLLVDTAGINPKVWQTILSSLFSTEPDLLETSLVLASPAYHFRICDFLAIILFPCVREYSILRYIALIELGQAEIAIVVVLQQTHYLARFEDRKEEGLGSS